MDRNVLGQAVNQCFGVFEYIVPRVERGEDRSFMNVADDVVKGLALIDRRGRPRRRSD